jgi:glycosyltransferase involved in cell wall biosynthesis
MLDISVIICSHNPRRNYLHRVLDALGRQSLPHQQWELLLIDNASDAPLEPDWDLSWHPNGRHVFEPELGLSAARLCGMRESSGTVIVFVDDDNVLDPDYLSIALSIDRAWPALGTWGSGATLPEFEIQPPRHLKDLLPSLALRDTAVARWGNIHTEEITPWGAGLCVRRQVADAYLRHWDESKFRITDRTGALLLGGGDVEISFVARDRGLGTGVFPELKLLHLIPKDRIAPDYLFKLYQAGCTTHFLLMYKWRGHIPYHPYGRHALGSTISNLVLLRGLERRQAIANNRAALEARRAIAAVHHKQ